MATDGWKLLEEAKIRREQELAWELWQQQEKERIADEQLREMGRAVKSGMDPAFPVRTNRHRTRTRRT